MWMGMREKLACASHERSMSAHSRWGWCAAVLTTAWLSMARWSSSVTRWDTMVAPMSSVQYEHWELVTLVIICLLPCRMPTPARYTFPSGVHFPTLLQSKYHLVPLPG